MINNLNPLECQAILTRGVPKQNFLNQIDAMNFPINHWKYTIYLQYHSFS